MSLCEILLKFIGNMFLHVLMNDIKEIECDVKLYYEEIQRINLHVNEERIYKWQK